MVDAVAPPRALKPLAVLRSIGKLGVAAPATVAAIAAHLGADAADLADPLAALVEAGRAAVWADRDGALRAAKIPTRREADRLSRRPRGPSGTPLASEVGVELHRLADPSAPDPTAGAIEGEDWSARARKAPRRKGGGFAASARPPSPRHLLGLDVPWTATPPEGPCEGCEGRPLDALSLCLYCGRWGLDGLVEQAEAIAAGPRPRYLAGGTGEAGGAEAPGGDGGPGDASGEVRQAVEDRRGEEAGVIGPEPRIASSCRSWSKIRKLPKKDQIEPKSARWIIEMGLHYVPQKYLRNFEDPTKPGWIWLHDKLGGVARLAPINKVAQAKGYYSEEDEKRLAYLVEIPGNNVVDKLLAEESISYVDRIDLAIYVATMMSRVPRRRRKSMELIPVVADQLGEVYRKTASEVVKDGSLDAESAAKRLQEFEKILDQCKREPSPVILDRIRDPRPTTTIIEAILGMCWRVLRTKGQQPFITTDNPAIFFEGIGLSHPDVELVMPLSSTRAFHASRKWPGGFYGWATIRPIGVREINKRMLHYAERLAFARESSPWIPKLFENSKPILSKLDL